MTIATNVKILSAAVKKSMKTFVVVNPSAAGGEGLRLWPALADDLHRAIGPFDYEFTNAAGAATLLAGQAVTQGYCRIVAVGGDGTLNEVINGFFTSDGVPINPDVVLGCLPAGSGTDFWKTLGIRDALKPALRILQGDRTRCCDLLRVELVGHDGRQMVRFGCNVADVGLGGEVVSRAKRLPAWGSGFFNYLVASAMAFWQWEPTTMRIVVDGEEMTPEPLIIAIVANGQYCGGGMWIAPEAELDDGLINLCAIRPMAKRQFLALLPRLYGGKLGDHPAFFRRTGRQIEVAASTPLKVTVDGEVPGIVPATFTILPKAIRIFC
ncbi:MAG: diacylglycerol kinase family lipid kinase [Deltaproteobacteria bacterium]|nr:diacylglycerol kinase family lipid kinase [Deltaproteobacteria bacterium]